MDGLMMKKNMGIITRTLLFSHRLVPKLCRGISPVSHRQNASAFSSSTSATACDSDNAAKINQASNSNSKALFGPHLFIPSKFEIDIGDNKNRCDNGVNASPDIHREHENEEIGDDYFQLLDLGGKKIVKTPKNTLGNLSWEREMLFPSDAICIGACLGWLAFLNIKDGGSLFLINPFTSSNNNNKIPPFISLPSVETLPFLEATRTSSFNYNGGSSALSPISPEFIGLNKNPKSCCMKLILSSSVSLPIYPYHFETPTYENIAVVIGGNKNDMACCRLGETSWFGFGKSPPECRPHSDVIYSSKDRLFYALAGGVMYSPKNGRYFPLRCPDRNVDIELQDTSIDEYDNYFGVRSEICVEAWDLSSRPFSPERKFLFKPSCKPCMNFPHDPNRATYRIWGRDPNYLGCFRHWKIYLVESSTTGDLLLVERLVIDFIDEDTNLPCSSKKYCFRDTHNVEPEDTRGKVREGHTYATACFHVYKLNRRKNEWEHLKCIGDQALILGLNHSTSLSTVDFPMLKKNSIYFTDDEVDEMVKSDKVGGHDFGVYDLEEGKVGSLFCSEVKKFEQPPVWILPDPA